jgi:hypothetical protein
LVRTAAKKPLGSAHAGTGKALKLAAACPSASAAAAMPSALFSCDAAADSADCAAVNCAAADLAGPFFHARYACLQAAVAVVPVVPVFADDVELAAELHPVRMAAINIAPIMIFAAISLPYLDGLLTAYIGRSGR